MACGEVGGSVMEPLREKCPDCGIGVSEEHSDGCDVARCLWTGLQRLSCEVFNTRGDDHDCGLDVWSGLWPGVVECEEFGWLEMVAVDGCLVAQHDLNRLVVEGEWDRQAQRWRQRRRRMG